MLNLIARDQATTDRWAIAEATYQEAISLARESGQQTELTFGLAGLAWLQARRGREHGVPRAAPPRRSSSPPNSGLRLPEVWATAALGELELGLGDAAQAAAHFERLERLLADLGITDVDLSPAADLVEAYLRLGAPRGGAAGRRAASWPPRRPRASPGRWPAPLRCQGLLARPTPAASPRRSKRR